MPRRFKIHPAIGVARVGNAPEAFFIGPEEPDRPGNWGDGNFNSFRDEAGRVKRQAARFRIFEYHEDGRAPTEVVVCGDNVTSIEWRVHIANKKASFFTFNGQSGAADVYVARSQRPASDPEKTNPERLNRRNANVPQADRQRLLEIDPGEQTVSTSTPNTIVLTNPNKDIPSITDLGELRLEESGRLLVLGGHGTSVSTATPVRQIDEYANNDTWFDDVGDGSVKVRIRLSDGTSVDAEAAWVLVGPPKFAPGILNVVRLYDTLWDLGVRELNIPLNNPLYKVQPLSDLVVQKNAWKASAGQSLAGYRPSFAKEIYPILKRAFSARDVHDPGEINRGYHLQLIDWNLLSRPDTGNERDDGRDLRQYVFSWMRNPRSTQVEWEKMPRGLGDDYTALDDYENDKRDNPLPTSLLSLTQIQYALLEQWSKGEFISDWPGGEPDVPPPGKVTPTGLDRAALENCVGSPFYPGIEVGWLIRTPELYSEPLRLRIPPGPESEQKSAPPIVGALQFGPGFFSQQMAQPWQADFYDCHKEKHEAPDGREFYYMWWTAQRPDEVYPAGSDQQQRWVRLFDKAKTTDDPDDLANLARFEQMQQHWHLLRFLIKGPEGANHKFEEEPQT